MFIFLKEKFHIRFQWLSDRTCENIDKEALLSNDFTPKIGPLHITRFYNYIGICSIIILQFFG